MDEMEYKPQSEQEGGKRLRKHTKKPLEIALLCAALVLLAGFGAACCLAGSSTTVFPGVSVLNCELGGAALPQAERLLQNDLAQNEDAFGIEFSADGESVYCPIGELGISIDCAASAQNAYNFGRGGNFLENGWRYLCGLLGKETAVLSACRVEKNSAEDGARAAAEALSVKAIPFSEAADTEGLHLTKQRNARTIAVNDVLSAIGRYGVQRREIAELPFGVTEMPAGDLAAIHAKYAPEVKNAGYDALTQSITPEQIHVDFDLAAAQAALDEAAPGETITLGAAELPAVTAESLAKVLFCDVIGSYTTKVGGAPGRHQNVRVTAGRINGVILNRGESIKYGELVTPFTLDNGYFPAPGYLQGKTVDMVGGGACQASSTLYAASLYADLEIVQRRNHGFASDYIGLGLDATVATGGPELEIRNNTEYPIKVEALFYTRQNKDYITINLYGTKTDDHFVKVRTEVLSTTPFTEEIVETDELKPGERVVEQTPYTGYDVRTYRQIYSGDGTLISETLEARSKYNVRNRIVKVGKAAEASAEAPTEIPVEPVEVPTEIPVEPVEAPTEVPAEPVEAPTETPTEPVGPEAMP